MKVIPSAWQKQNEEDQGTYGRLGDPPRNERTSTRSDRIVARDPRLMLRSEIRKQAVTMESFIRPIAHTSPVSLAWRDAEMLARFGERALGEHEPLRKAGGLPNDQLPRPGGRHSPYTSGAGVSPSPGAVPLPAR
jgi:hypothetical protein